MRFGLPAHPEELECATRHMQELGLVKEERQDASGFAPKPVCIDKKVMVALDGESAVGSSDCAKHIQSGGEIFKRVVNKIPGEHCEVGPEAVCGVDDPFENFPPGEPSDVEVADVGNGEAFQRLGKVRQFDGQFADPELFKLQKTVARSAQRGETWKSARGHLEEFAARQGGGIWRIYRRKPV